MIEYYVENHSHDWPIDVQGLDVNQKLWDQVSAGFDDLNGKTDHAEGAERAALSSAVVSLLLIAPIARRMHARRSHWTFASLLDICTDPRAS